MMMEPPRRVEDDDDAMDDDMDKYWEEILGLNEEYNRQQRLIEELSSGSAAQVRSSRDSFVMITPCINSG